MGPPVYVAFFIALAYWLPCNQGAPFPIKIGAIFHNGDEEHNSVFLQAIKDVNRQNIVPIFELQPIIKWINLRTDSFSTAAAACELIEEGVAAIFGPTSPHTRGVVSSIATRFDIPHIEFAWRPPEDSTYPPTGINVYPNSKNVIQAIADLVKVLHWKQFVAIYETNDGLARIQQALTLYNPKVWGIVRELDGNDYRPLLKEITNSHFNIIVSINVDRITDVFKKLLEIKPSMDYIYYIITELDIPRLSIQDVLSPFRINVTGFGILTDNVDDVNANLGFNMQVESAVLYDAVFLFNDALDILNERIKDDEETQLVIEPPQLSCGGTEKYFAGPNITSVMREIAREGKLTGHMTFDEEGNRYFELRVMEYQKMGLKHIGMWNKEHGVEFTRTEKDHEGDQLKLIEQKHFKITTRVGPPYVMEVTDGSTRGINIGKKRYEGYCIDLIDQIASNLHFEYTFELVPDGLYGAHDPKTDTWNGLIGRILSNAADLAICDFTITYERQSVVDFTMPFMTLGISILYSKPEPKDPNLFSFLSPLSTDVWIYMATAYLGVSVMLFLQARVAPGEWDNPHPCNPEPEELENNFNLKNSLWLTMGSIMQQGSDILPKAPSIRMVASMWYFFTLIMISSYTANLAAFLTNVKMDSQITSAEDLAKQTKIKYGSVESGSTTAFFRGSNFSTYQRMWAAMSEARPKVFTANNDEGVDRVLKGKRNYAFLMESTTIEYRVLRNCNLMPVGDPLDNKGYGIAMPLNSPYRTTISHEILSLQENGYLARLKDKWWKDMHGGDTCSESPQNTDSSELGMANVGGVFLVLMCGCAFSFLVAVLEFIWNVRKVAVDEKITPYEALIAELKFAVNIWAQTKPVKVAKSSSATSSAPGGLGRAASTARSIVGSFLRLDMLDKFDKENTTNNETN